MACITARSNIELVKNLTRNGIIRNSRVGKLMAQVDRGNYCKKFPYLNIAQDIGFGAKISAPHMHAYALDLLSEHLLKGAKVLDVGSGSGYLTACMALMVGEKGLALGIENNTELAEMAIENIKKDYPQLIDSKSCRIIVGDSYKGYRSEAPFDAIHVGSPMASLPEELMRQLKPGGRMLVATGDYDCNQAFDKIDKLPDGGIIRESMSGITVIPLADEEAKEPIILK